MIKVKDFDVYSNDMYDVNFREHYKITFNKKFADKIDADDTFFWSGQYIVDATAGCIINVDENCNTINLENCTWRQITKMISKYFYLDM